MAYTINDIARLITEDPDVLDEGISINDSDPTQPDYIFDFQSDSPKDIVEISGKLNTVYEAVLAKGSNESIDAILAFEIKSLTSASSSKTTNLQQLRSQAQLSNKTATGIKNAKKIAENQFSKLLKNLKGNQPTLFDFDIAGDESEQKPVSVYEYFRDSMQNLIDKLDKSIPADDPNLKQMFLYDLIIIMNDIKDFPIEDIQGINEQIEKPALASYNNLNTSQRKINALIHQCTKILQYIYECIDISIDNAVGQTQNTKTITKQITGIKQKGKEDAKNLNKYIQKDYKKGAPSQEVQDLIKIAGKKLEKIAQQYSAIVLAGKPKPIIKDLLAAANIQAYTQINKKPSPKIEDIFDFHKYAKADKRGQDSQFYQQNPKTINVAFYNQRPVNLYDYYNKGIQDGFKLQYVTPTMRKYFTLYDTSMLPQVPEMLIVDDTVQTGSTAKMIKAGTTSYVAVFALFATEALDLTEVQI